MLHYFHTLRCIENKQALKIPGQLFLNGSKNHSALYRVGLGDWQFSKYGAYEMASLHQWDRFKLQWANLVRETGWVTASWAPGMVVKKTYLPEPWCGSARRAWQSCSRCPSRPHPSGCWHRCTAVGSQCCRSRWLLWSSSWTDSAAPPHQLLLSVLRERKGRKKPVISCLQGAESSHHLLG